MLLLEVVIDKKMNLDEIKIIFENTIGKVPLTLSWRRPLSYRNKSIDLLCKSMDWFRYDNGPFMKVLIATTNCMQISILSQQERH